jgi:lactoylglutathione lyase
MSERGTLGWVIVYVPDVERAVEFYERAFGLTRAFVDPTGNFGQLDTGSTALAFAAEALADGHLPYGVRRPGPDEPPANVELALVFDDVHAAFAHAVAEGCTALAEPAHQPQNQVVGWVRDPFGTLVEIASPIGVS